MSSSKNTSLILVVSMAACIVALEEEDKRQRPKYWVSPYLQERALKGRYASDTPSMFFENFHMPQKSFNTLFGMVEQYLIPKRNTRPDAIPIKAKLAIVLEFLASGDLQRHIGSTYRISKQHFGVILLQVSIAIWTALRDEFPKWTTGNMLIVDGKHVAIKGPPNCGSLFYNYKGFHSIVLMAICNAHYRFTYIDVGAFGSEGDMNAFSHSALGKQLLLDQLPFPEDNVINGHRTPYYIVGDDAFPLHKRIMKPYSGKDLHREERIFNYRLSRAHRCIENAFGILSARWMAVQRTLLSNPCKAQKIIVACCALHNFLMRESPATYSMQEIPSTVLTDLRPCRRGRPQDFSKEVRNNLKEYLNGSAGSVPWQDESAGVQRN
ncbi:putative nuclease HARBI1 isoform X2 [Drosophila rhopaloa]|uniref:DDE Tnp4 domain-containing protein n=1 Tax=Drosophila rhopaloa TaxID=1041015 RepID=A0ABM5J624_DRORH|nr:putative nuclease HARBI1 isoform X2 [Drosophila rhopaloa]